MKKYLKTLALFLVFASLMSAFGVFACADSLQSGKEIFAEAPYDEDGEESDYRQLAYKVCQFDEDMVLPTEESVLSTYDGEVKFVQSKYGVARGQKLYAAPGEYDDDEEGIGHVRDCCRVLVHGEDSGFCFVELLFLDGSEGSFGWIPEEYVVEEWSFPLSITRSEMYGGW